MQVKKLSKMVDRNFVIDNSFLTVRDIELFFGREDVTVLPATASMLDILVETGIFQSKGAARKNGWENKQAIPLGFSEFEIGKLKHCITILKPSEVWEE